jgi:hypothetical protein
MNGFNTGDWVWVPDQDKVVVAAEVVGNFMPGQPGSLRLDCGEVRSSLNPSRLSPFNPHCWCVAHVCLLRTDN